jgi:hypothetical protein
MPIIKDAVVHLHDKLNQKLKGKGGKKRREKKRKGKGKIVPVLNKLLHHEYVPFA